MGEKRVYRDNYFSGVLTIEASIYTLANSFMNIFSLTGSPKQTIHFTQKFKILIHNGTLDLMKYLEVTDVHVMF